LGRVIPAKLSTKAVTSPERLLSDLLPLPFPRLIAGGIDLFAAESRELASR
jgi:hypothetical protein